MKNALTKLFVVPAIVLATAAQADNGISSEDLGNLSAAYQLLTDGDLVGAQEAYKALRTTVDSIDVQRAATEGEAFALMQQLNQLSDKSKAGATVGPLLRGRQRITVNFIADQLEAHSSETLSYLLTLAESDLQDPSPDYSQLAFAGDLAKLPVELAPVAPTKPEAKPEPKPEVAVAIVAAPEPKETKPATKVTEPVKVVAAKPNPVVETPKPAAAKKEPERVEKALANLVKMPTTNVKVRSGPGRNFKHIGLVKKGQRLVVNQRVSVSGGGDWYRIVSPKGYAAASLFTAYQVPKVAPKTTPVVQFKTKKKETKVAVVKAKPKPVVVAPKPKKIVKATPKPKPVVKKKPKPAKQSRRKAAAPKGKCALKNSGIVLRTSAKIRVLSSPGGGTMLHYNPNVSISNVISEQSKYYVLRIRSNGASACGYVRKGKGVKRIR